MGLQQPVDTALPLEPIRTLSAKCCCTQFFAVLSLGNLGTTLHQRGRRICFFVSWEKRKRARAVRSWPAPASWGQRGVYQNDLLSPPQSWSRGKSPSREDRCPRGAISAIFLRGLAKLPPSPLQKADSRAAPTAGVKENH